MQESQVHDMSGNVIDIDDLANEVMQCLTEYSEDVDKEVKKAVRKTATSVKKELNTTSPKDSGKYANSWKASLTQEKGKAFHMTVHAEKYQIAHLLENGHAIRRGGRSYGKVSAKPHIKKAEENGEKLIEKLITNALG